MFRRPGNAFGGWLMLGLYIYLAYAFGTSRNWDWIGISVCVGVVLLFIGITAYLWISTILEGRRIMKISPDELFPSDLGSRRK
jgi:hypothetical protein